jgi:hypothetical protein
MFAFPERWANKIRISEHVLNDDEYGVENCPCWDWTGWNTGHGDGRGRGYGKVRRNGKGWMAHRAMYCEMVGPIPEGLELDHRCDRRICVNPRHLRPVTRLENILRSSVALYQTDSGYERASTMNNNLEEIPF